MYRIRVIFLIFVGHALSLSYFFLCVDCAVDLGIISTEDVMKIANREIDEENDNDFAIRTCLEFVKLLANMSTIRKDATESALKFLLTRTRKNNFDGAGILRKRTRFEIKDEGKGNEKHKRIATNVLNANCSKASNIVMSEVTVGQDEFNLGEFSISYNGIINLDGDFMYE